MVVTVTTSLPSTTMDPNGYYNGYNGYNQYQQSDVNPYHQPYAGPSYPIPGSSSGHSAPVPANAYEYDVGILAQQSVYVPGAMIDKRGGAGGKLAKGGKRTTVLRKGGGKVWEDQTLLEWNPCRPLLIVCHLTHLDSSSHMTCYIAAWFRLFVGDLSNDVSDDVLANAFNKYPSFQKARVIRDRLSQKVQSSSNHESSFNISLIGEIWICSLF
jgi:hypothetical protein